MAKTVMCQDVDGSKHRISVDKLRWRPSAYGIVIKDGCVLVSEQFGGLVLPGGGIDLGELPEETVVREIKEETGIDVANPELLAMESTFFKLPESHKGEYIQSIMLYYACKATHGNLSTDAFTDYDLKYTGQPQWLPLELLDSVKVAGTVDWRKFVRNIA